MSLDTVFHDRRRSPSVDISLTPQQNALMRAVGAPLEERDKAFAVEAEQHRDAVRWAHNLESVAQNPAERRVARNLCDKVVSAVVAANPETCPSCSRNGCPACAYTGRRLAG